MPSDGSAHSVAQWYCRRAPFPTSARIPGIESPEDSVGGEASVWRLDARLSLTIWSYLSIRRDQRTWLRSIGDAPTRSTRDWAWQSAGPSAWAVYRRRVI